MSTISGIHHVTAFAGDAKPNRAFYSRVLGLRLVKRTVNYDDPSTHHLYYADAAGTPGTVLTFFPWPGGRPRDAGASHAGEVAAVTLGAPAGALEEWSARLSANEVEATRAERFGAPVLAFRDPDGLPLEIAESDASVGHPWDRADVPAPIAIRAIHGATMTLADLEPTTSLLRGVFGLESLGTEGGRQRLRAGEQSVDLVATDAPPAAAFAPGMVHHIAWRAADEAELRTWRATLTDAGLKVTQIRDRSYFKSIYFREPGGVIFEIATDDPGFEADEPGESLGTSLKLPAWLEPQRGAIERRLPPLD